MTVNYASKIKSFVQTESQSEYLIFDELQRLAKAEYKYPVLKKAFLFSYLSGLSWSDINTLIWKEVRDEGDISRVNFRQEKTEVKNIFIFQNKPENCLAKDRIPKKEFSKAKKLE